MANTKHTKSAIRELLNEELDVVAGGGPHISHCNHMSHSNHQSSGGSQIEKGHPGAVGHL